MKNECVFIKTMQKYLYFFKSDISLHWQEIWLPMFKFYVTNLDRLIKMGTKEKHESNRNTRTRCEICSKLTIKTPERR